MTRRLAIAVLLAILAAFVTGPATAAPRSGPELTAPAASSAGSPSPSEAPYLAGVSPAPQVALALAEPVSPTNAPVANVSPGRLSGLMSWFCGHGSPCTTGYAAPGAFAAAGPVLRAALGPDWRGRAVTVSVGGRSVVVTLVDWCGCLGTRLLDGYASVWAALGLDLRAGLVTVEVVG